MTEQEKREKAIEEMAHIVVTDCKNTCKNCGIYGWCIGLFNATRFYDAGYRKEEEVRKEVAKEFLDKIMERVVDLDTHYDGLHFVVETKDILDIAKDFDVE